MPIDVASRLRRDVTCGHHHTFKSVFARAPRDIDHELTPDDRIVVSERNAWNFVPQSQRNHLFRARADASRGVKLCLADAPVLAKTTSQVATRRTKAQDRGSRKKMVEGLLFYRINRETARIPIPERVEFSPEIFADVAKPGLPVADPTIARAQSAEDSPVVLGSPP